MKLLIFSITIVLLLAFCSQTDHQSIVDEMVVSLPETLNLDPFYKKYIDANGIPIISSENVRDEALVIARDLVNIMLSKRSDIRDQYIQQSGKIAIIGANEQTTDIPEYRDLYEAFPGTDWNKRARGLGATLPRPVSSAGEENLICMPQDRYHGEDILTHEFAHGILNLGIRMVEPDIDSDLNAAYNNAREEGLWENTYAISNKEEYFAEGVQTWFNVNKEVEPANGIHNWVNTREELKAYDPLLYELLSRYFPEENGKISCKLL